MSNHDEVDDEARDKGFAKDVALGLHYGMGPSKLRAFVTGGQVEPPTVEVPDLDYDTETQLIQQRIARAGEEVPRGVETPYLDTLELHHTTGRGGLKDFFRTLINVNKRLQDLPGADIVLTIGEPAIGAVRYEGYPDKYFDGQLADGTLFRHKDVESGVRLVEFVPTGDKMPWGAHSELCDYNRVGEYCLTWVGWLEKYEEYVRDEETPIFRRVLNDQVAYREYHNRRLAEVKGEAEARADDFYRNAEAGWFE